MTQKTLHKKRISNVKLKYLLLFLLGLIQGCVERYEPNISKYESLMVVDAILTNQAGSAHVTLSKTYPYNKDVDTYIDDALVKLIDENGIEYAFLNEKQGSYILADSLFEARVGEKYKIYIETPDGTVCESTYETITQPVAIDSIYYEFVDSDDDKSKGLQILMDVKNNENRSQYFAWEYIETWEFEVPYVSSYVPNSLVCYRTARSSVFLIQSTKEYSQGNLTEYPVYFIDNTTNRLLIKYSVLISQYSLNESTYTFLKDLKEINEEQGTLFDKAPMTLIGNLINLTDPNIPVLGNFQVSAVFTKRLTLKNRDFTFRLDPPSGFEDCMVKYLSTELEQGRLDSFLRTNWSVIDTLIYTEPVDTLVGISNSVFCYDCKVSGTIIKPDYWDEE
jgi:hypothetical protein